MSSSKQRGLPNGTPSPPIIRFTNVRLVKGGRLTTNEELWIQGGRILNPEPVFFDQRVFADISIDCRGLIIAPGYIELQINGGFGYDFSNPAVDMPTAIEVVSRNLVKHGVTAYCPTLVTQPAANYAVLLPQIRRGPVAGGATILGVHVEGPFISPKKKGAHPEEYIQQGELGSLERIQAVYSDLANVALMTVAPELDPTGDVIRRLAEYRRPGEDEARVGGSIVVSLGHSTANLAESERAFASGARMITHLFNAMPLFHHRDPGLLGLLTVDGAQPVTNSSQNNKENNKENNKNGRQIYYGIIADGIHTHYSALRLAYHANRTGMVLVSDAISACGLSSGIHMIGTQRVEIKDQCRAYVAGTDTLCGAIALLDHCVKNLFASVDGCSVVEAVDCATLHPARAMGIEGRKGTLNFESDADFILLGGESLDVLATFVDGRLVFVDEARCPVDLSALLKTDELCEKVDRLKVV